jgi:hypothetical protein
MGYLLVEGGALFHCHGVFSTYYPLCSSFFGSPRVGTQDLMLARKTHYHLNHSSSLFFFFSILEIGSHQLLAWGWLRTWSSWLTRIIGMNHWCWALFSFFPSYKPVFSTSSSCPVFTLSYLCSIPSPPFYFSLLCCHHMKNFQLSIIVTKELRQSTYKEEVLIWAPGFSPWWLGPVERQYVLVGSTGWSKVLNDDSKCKKKKKELGPGKPSRAQLWWPKFLPLGPAS